jgi:hypothetical protein
MFMTSGHDPEKPQNVDIDSYFNFLDLDDPDPDALNAAARPDPGLTGSETELAEPIPPGGFSEEAKRRLDVAEMRRLRKLAEPVQQSSDTSLTRSLALTLKSLDRLTNTLRVFILLFMVSAGAALFFSYYISCTTAQSCFWTMTTSSKVTTVSPPVPQSKPQSEPLTVDPAQEDFFREAVNAAMQAVKIGETAQSATDWDHASVAWIAAIEMMQAVPPNSSRYELAQQKAQEYLGKLAIAQRRARTLRSLQLN